jgi:hypothetical protein
MRLSLHSGKGLDFAQGSHEKSITRSCPPIRLVFHRTPDGGLRKALLPGGFHVPRDLLAGIARVGIENLALSVHCNKMRALPHHFSNVHAREGLNPAYNGFRVESKLLDASSGL